jgi:DNA helicase II / ATP-dependent DNA helicase PcrA
MGSIERCRQIIVRLPRITQLTQQQKDVYLYAPADQHVLVHGPPGTGKTLIACLRAIELQKKHVPVVLGMFNKVLSRYSANAGDGTDLPSQTIRSWFYKWWQSSGLPPHNGPEVKIVINAPFEANSQLRALGARWDPKAWRPGKRKPGAWVIEGEQYQATHDSFSSEWQIYHDPPNREGTKWIDWSMACEHIASFDDSLDDSALSLGTLLIDEGQDFPPAFYDILRRLSAVGLHRGSSRVPHPLRCFVLADENQQITEENSTLDQIVSSLKIKEKNRYLLLDNFRNSREIALLARGFFNDVSVLPNLPDRSSEKPTYLTVPDHSTLGRRVRTWIVNNPGKEVAVFSFSEITRDALCQAVGNAVSDLRGRDITVQTYSSKTWAENKANKLVFDSGDVVTVLNLQSCKGLEFDAVFIADLYEAKATQQAADRFKMQMFVAVSRSREFVTLIDSGPRAGTGEYVKYLPDNSVLERESSTSSARTTSIRSTKSGNAMSVEATKTGGKTKANEVTSEWEAEVRTFAGTKRLDTEDNRSKGGAYWVFAGLELSDSLKPLGFQYSAKRSAWWRK